MKVQLILAFVAVLGVAQCMRLPRQIPAAGFPGAGPAGASAPAAGPAAAPVNVPAAGDSPVPAPVGAVAGNPPVPAPGAAAPPNTAGMNVALSFMVDELDKETALGGPANPAGLKKALILATKIQLLGGEVDTPTKDKLDTLSADFALQAANPADFSVFAAPPAAAAAPAPGPMSFFG